MNNNIIFVAPDGKTDAAGNINDPISIQSLKETLISAKKPVTVYFRGGVYDLSGTDIVFDSKTSGEKNTKITFTAYKNEKPVLSGGYKLDFSKAKKVTDKEILNRITDKNAREGLYVLDVSDVIGNIAPIERIFEQHETTFFMNGHRMHLARWPKMADCKNNSYYGSWLYAQNILHEEPFESSPFHLKTDASVMDHIRHFWSKESMKTARISGYLWHNWFYNRYPITEYDFENNELTSAYGTQCPFCCDPQPFYKYRRYFFCNVLEELSDHLEYYLDYERKLFYFYPESLNDEIYFTLNRKPAFRFENAENFCIDKLSFMYFTDIALELISCKNFEITNCELAYGSTHGLVVEKTEKLYVTSNKIHDFGSNCLSIYRSGDPKTCRSSEIVIENNDLYNCCLKTRCESTCIVSNYNYSVVIRKNKIHGSPNSVVYLGDVDTVFEYNEIYDAVIDTDDAGAIYWGRRADTIGMKIRYNYFHDIGQNRTSTWGIGAIFTDDEGTGAEIYGNIFNKASMFGDDGAYALDPHPEVNTLKLNSAQFVYAHDNIFVMSTQREKPMEDVKPRETTQWAKACLGAYVPELWNKQWLWHDQLCNIGLFEDDGITPKKAWREHYKGTIWAPIFDLLIPENYHSGALDPKGKPYGIPELREKIRKNNYSADQAWDIFEDYMLEVMKKYGRNFVTNMCERNIIIDMNGKFIMPDGDTFTYAKHRNNMYLSKEEADKYFKDIDHNDFSLTKEGKNAVAKVIDKFCCINVSDIVK